MGRETAIQELVRDESGWFRLKDGGCMPALQVNSLASAKPRLTDKLPQIERDDFTGAKLPDHFQWLRTPWPESFLSLADRPCHLRLYGQESPGSFYHQSLLARRQVHFNYEAVTAVCFEPENFQQMAGLICYYNASKFHYCCISHDKETGKHLAVISGAGEVLLQAKFPAYAQRIPLPQGREILLRAQVSGSRLEFAWSLDATAWNTYPAALDYSLLSDEAGKGEGAQFTGSFVGMACHDVSGGRMPADFRFFSYAGTDAG
jgi:xylan 1,4-beta-xylosidase